jgi:hypothetical protein
MDEGAEIEKLDQAQHDIGWKALLNGQVSTVWKKIQHQCFLFLGKRNSGERWVRLLIKKLRDVAWDQLEHRNEVVHKKENVVTQEEAEQLNGWIREAIRIGQGLVLAGDEYLFRNITVDLTFQWTLARKKHWKRFVETAWKAYQDTNE